MIKSTKSNWTELTKTDYLQIIRNLFKIGITTLKTSVSFYPPKSLFFPDIIRGHKRTIVS